MPASFSRGLLLVSLLSCACAMACGKKEEEAKPPSGPIVGVGELPVSLRLTATAPPDAHEVEISPSEIHVGSQPLITLAGGNVAAADRQGSEIPKLTAALKSPVRARASFAISSEVPYETVALAISSAKAAGLRGIAFKVRAPNSMSTTGFIALDDFSVGPRTKIDEEVALSGVVARPWEEFTAHWEDIGNACRGAQTGSCAYKPEKIATGGHLKIALLAAGQGVNVNFSQVGAPPPAEAPKKPKVEMLDGVKKTDIVKDVEEAPPATDASFQFRAQEALKVPSPVSEVMKPICGTTACGVVLNGEKNTMFVRVASLLGAAFPDNTPAPIVQFELP